MRQLHPLKHSVQSRVHQTCYVADIPTNHYHGVNQLLQYTVIHAITTSTVYEQSSILHITLNELNCITN